MSGNLWMFSDMLDDEDIEMQKHDFMRTARAYMFYALKKMGMCARDPHAFLPMLLCDSVPSDRAIALKFGMHNLRHTFCTRLCEVESNIKYIQDIMGHSDAKTTMDIYNEVTKEFKEQTSKKLQGVLQIA